MGIIIREYLCGDCGHKFESSDPADEVTCPQCTSPEAERAFFTAPSIRSPQTTFKDHTVKQLASDFGLSDVSNKHGEPVKKAPAAGPAPQFSTPNPQVMAAVQRLGSNADAFSPVLPSLSRAGGPAPSWAARDGRNKPIR